MRGLARLTGIIGPVLALGAVLAGDYEESWPQWRGPLANGVAPHASPPLTWSEDSNVRWKIELPGQGLSTPIVWGDRIFLTTGVDAGPRPDPEAAAAAEAAVPEWRRESGIAPSRVIEFTLLALDRGTGEIVWRKVLKTGAPHEGLHSDSTWASASVVTDGKRLVAQFGSNGTYGLDLQGNLKWERDLGDMQTRRGFGEGSSPVIHGDTLIVNWDHEGPSFIVALDVDTGETLWREDRDEVTSWSTPLVVDSGDRPQVVVSATHRTRGYDLGTGDVIWEAGGMTTNTIPSPVHAGERVFVMSGYRGLIAQAIDLGKARGDVTDSEAIAWRYEQDTPYVPSPLLLGDRLYFLKHNKGILSCLSAKDGTPYYGPVRLDGIDGVYASPVAAAGRVYVLGRDGTTLVLKDGDTFEVLASNTLDDAFDASPAVAGRELFLRGRKHLYCIAE